MTKMEEDAMNGGESQAEIPTSNQTTSPASKEGGGGARFCGKTRSPVPAVYEKEFPMSCASCNGKIFDKYYMRVDGKSWHEGCVQCAVCRQPLSDSCYSKNFKLYCREDYKRLQRCHKCTGSISGEELVMRVGQNSYHVECFSCDYCQRRLHSGDHYLTDNVMRICCKGCYDNDDGMHYSKGAETDSEESMKDNDEVFSPSLQPPTHSHLTPTHYLPHITGAIVTSTNDPKRSKRPRTILTTAQRRKFKASFEISQKPCRKVRETLAQETGLTPRVVQVWFQNQRAKMKKLARRQTQGESGMRRGKRKKDADSDSENEIPSSPGSYTSSSTPHHNQYYADYQSPTSPTASQEGNIPEFFSPHQHHHGGINHNEVYEEYDSQVSIHNPIDDTYMHQAPPPTVTSQILDNTSEIHHMIQQEPRAIYDVTSMTSHSDVIHHHDDVRCHHHEEAYPYPTTQERMVTTTDVANPMDSLLFMQNSYFRT